MALLAPIAFAAGGAVLTGGATWGMAAGWLIGSWLFGPKAENNNKVFDPGEEELPSFNQALRGSTMPVLFGTNRVSSQIVWTKNWTVIRKESSSGGGGKSGGSGMGGKQGSQQGEVTYEYKWDLMFHIGMSDQNVDLLGGWLISERLNGETVAAILAGADSQWATFNALIKLASDADSVWEGVAIGAQASSNEIGADFDFEDSYYHGAGATGGDFDNWAHFQTEEGGNYRWPYTCYVGFKQFNLGATARVPQITWEVGEGGASLTANGATVESEIPVNSIYMAQGSHPYGYFIKAQDGTLMKLRANAYFVGPNFNDVVLENIATGASTGTIITEAEFVTDFNDFWGGSFAGTDSTLGYSWTAIEDRYLLISRRNGTARMEYMLYTVDDGDGNITPVGSMRFGDPGLDSYFQNMNFCSISGAGTDDDYIHYYTNGGSGIGAYRIYHWKGPSINQMKNGTWYLTGSDDIVDGVLIAAVSDVTNGESDKLNANTYYQVEGCAGSTVEVPTQRRGFSLPKITVGLLSLDYEDRFYYLVNKSTATWHNDNPGSGSAYYEAQSATYPNGFIKSLEGKTWTITDGVSILGTAGGTAFNGNGRFVDTAGNSVFPFDDDYQDEDGNNNSNNTYHEYTVTAQKLRTGFGAGGYLVIFWKQIYDTTDFQKTSPVGFPTRARVFIYNPISETFTQYANLFGSVMTNLETDMSAGDWSSGTPALGDTDGIIGSGTLGGYYDESTGTLYATWGIRLGITNGNVATEQVGKFGDLNISGGEDITPPIIIYRILTSSVYGLGISESDIDNDSYGLANQYCEAEGIKVSVQYRREESALAVIDELLSLYGGFLIDSGGKIKFGIQEFSTSPTRTIDNDSLRIDQDGEPPVTITKGARQDTYNRVKVNYFDRSLDYRQNFIEISDEVDQDLNGVRAQEFPAKFVMSEATAQKIASRALWGNMYARDIYDFKLGSKDADLEPGDVITLVDSYHTELQGGVQARIVQWQEVQPLTFQVRAVEEVEYVNASTLAADDVTEATKNVLNLRPKPMAEFGMYELPDEFQGADAQLFVGYRQQSAIMGARLYVSADGVTYGLAGDEQPYVISGIFLNGLPDRPPGYVEENVEVYLMPDTASGGFNTTTPYFAQKHTLDDVTASGRAAGLGNIWAGSEMLAFEGVNLVAQNWYRFDKLYRGWGGTHIQAQNSGDTWWKQAAGIFTQGINQDKIGTLIYYKVTGYNFNGVEYNLSSVDARTYQILGTYWRPQVQAPIATYVQSPGSYLTVQSEDLGYIQRKQVIAGGSPVQFEWPQSAREAGYGAQGYGVPVYGQFNQDTSSVSYRIEVLSSDLSTVVRCTTVDTTAFLYTTDLNSEDWTGWNGSFAVRITPYNPLGTALRSRTKILELFE